jgi:hypothetical protein
MHIERSPRGDSSTYQARNVPNTKHSPFSSTSTPIIQLVHLVATSRPSTVLKRLWDIITNNGVSGVYPTTVGEIFIRSGH